MQHVTGIRPQRMAVPTVATASAAGPPRVGKTLPATEGGWWSPLGERATPCFSNQPLISQAKAKQRLRLRWELVVIVTWSWRSQIVAAGT